MSQNRHPKQPDGLRSDGENMPGQAEEIMEGRFNRERVRFHTKKKNTLVIQGWFEDDEDGAEQFAAKLDGRMLPLGTVVQRGVEVTKKYLRYRTNVMTEYFLMIALPEDYAHAGMLRVYHIGSTGNSVDTSCVSGSDVRAAADGGGAAEPAMNGRSGQDDVPEQDRNDRSGQDDVPEQDRNDRSGQGDVPEQDINGRSGHGEKEKQAAQRCIFSATGRALHRLSQRLDSWMEALQELPDGRYQLRGWYMGCAKAEIALLKNDGSVIPAECAVGQRLDILGEFPEAEFGDTRGFELTFDRPEGNYLRLALKGGGRKALYVVNCSKMLSGREGLVNLCRKSYRYLKRKGFRQFTKRVSDVVLGVDTISYERWRRKYGVTRQELERQKTEHLAYEPKFSIVVPVYRTPEKFLRGMIASVEHQTYTNWELVLSDGSGADSPVSGLLDEYAGKDGRIRVLHNGTQLRIAQNTNAALDAASGDYIIFGDHDDLLSPDALYECARAVNENHQAELIYSDEDKTDGGGKRFFEPHFKPDYSPDLLTSMNYFCHLVCVARSLYERAGQLDPSFDGAQDYDYVLRCTEQTEPERIVHIPKILYHWRSHSESTAENPESKRYAFEAGARAVQAHFDRLGIRAKVHEGEYPGLYETDYEILGEPLISILIPNKDHIADLRKCISSIEERSDYRNYEYIIIENNSTKEETFAEYGRLLRENPKIRVVYYKGDFNFSDINNFGAQYARGEYFLLLNNDTEMINGDCLRQLLGPCQREEVGIVGARLYYEDNVIQHAGVVLGFGGIAGHAFIGDKRGDNGYFSRIICAQNYSAVTAACMMVKASVYRAVGGMSADLKVAFNDVDFCMKVRSTGKLIVYNPRAELYHYESKSRGLENTQEKIERFNREMACFLDRWGGQVKAGDPYYNPNLTLDKANFSLKV